MVNIFSCKNRLKFRIYQKFNIHKTVIRELGIFIVKRLLFDFGANFIVSVKTPSLYLEQRGQRHCGSILISRGHVFTQNGKMLL